MSLASDGTSRVDVEPQRRMRRAYVVLPSGLTLANLFCGIYAIVAASRGQFDFAGLLIILGGCADALDGRVARATGSGSRFGSELDSLVDVVTFGLAPAVIMYFAVLNKEGWEWLIVWL
ncbi:MAG TPA: CDP-alcohol phosphatidyltransferase family protein, partial [Gemmatimonadaceae bacterium]|nr:CDP-alcohol phosphatidyltransferase family protein [Gemmatimonadaceae bacterium]